MAQGIESSWVGQVALTEVLGGFQLTDGLAWVTQASSPARRVPWQHWLEGHGEGGLQHGGLECQCLPWQLGAPRTGRSHTAAYSLALEVA